MAFTTAERVKLRTYLGRSLLYQDAGTILESTINKAEATAGYEDAIRVHLTELAAIETSLSNAKDNLILTRAEDVNFAGNVEVLSLCDLGRRQINAIAVMLGWDPLRDYFDQFVNGTAGGWGNGVYGLG